MTVALIAALACADPEAFLTHERASLASREQLSRIHDKQYIDCLFQLAPQQGFVNLDPDKTLSVRVESEILSILSIPPVLKQVSYISQR